MKKIAIALLVIPALMTAAACGMREPAPPVSPSAAVSPSALTPETDAPGTSDPSVTPDISPSQEVPGAGESAGVINPRTEYDTVEEASAALAFTPMVPAQAPEGYALEQVAVIDGQVLELTYGKGPSALVYRTAEGTADISGDYTDYTVRESAVIAGRNVTMKGEEGALRLVTWIEEGQSFALGLTETLDLEALEAFMGSIA